MLAHAYRFSSPSVEVVYSLGEWFVRVAEGDRNLVSTFDRQALALVFAEEEMERIGAYGIVITDADATD